MLPSAKWTCRPRAKCVNKLTRQHLSRPLSFHSMIVNCTAVHIILLSQTKKLVLLFLRLLLHYVQYLVMQPFYLIHSKSIIQVLALSTCCHGSISCFSGDTVTANESNERLIVSEKMHCQFIYMQVCVIMWSLA